MRENWYNLAFMKLPKKTTLVIFFFNCVFIASCLAGIITDLSIPQDAVLFLKQHHIPQYEIKPEYQQQLTKHYLFLYFSPWTNPYYFMKEPELKSYLWAILSQYIHNPGWGENKHPYTREWIRHIVENVNMKTFPNAHSRAITIRATDLRDLPTQEPSYTNWVDAGEGYPFDNLQISRLNANVPVYIVQTSNDGAWKFVVTSRNAFGWIPSNDVAYVDNAFMNHWMQGHYVQPKRDGVGVSNDHSHFYFLTSVGQIYPLIKADLTAYQILVAAADADQHAVIKTATISKQNAILWPLLANTTQIAMAANRMMNQPYGWGGLYSYRDCSATLMDLFAQFGIWLPRSSTMQGKHGEVISFKNLTNEKKRQLINQKGIPFFSLFHMTGHIVLNVGGDDNIYIFNNKWGLRTYGIMRDGRVIIGRTVIMPIDFGKDIITVKENLLTRADGMVFIVPQNEIKQITLTISP